MAASLILFSALFACQTSMDAALASAALHSPEEAKAEAALADAGAVAQAGLAPATESLRALRQRLDALPAEQLARAQVAGHTLIVNCPFNRGAAQLPLVMKQVLDRHADPALAPLKAGVAEHVAVVEQLGLSALPMPAWGDYLYMASPGLVTGETLAASPDPVSLSLLLMEDLPWLVQGYDEPTWEKIHQAGVYLGAATQERWPLKAELIGFTKELDRLMATENLSPAAFADVEALSGLLDEYVGHGC